VAARLRNEYVVSIRGKLRLRKDPNPKIPTGLLELLAEDIQVGGPGGGGGGGVGGGWWWWW
jgi:aspartyl-tRNA synthetase